MKSIRIGAGLGFYGDHWEPVVASIERGGVQFIASDHLAELTLAILQKDRQRDPTLGYARTFVSQVEDCLGLSPPRHRFFFAFLSVFSSTGIRPEARSSW